MSNVSGGALAAHAFGPNASRIRIDRRSAIKGASIGTRLPIRSRSNALSDAYDADVPPEARVPIEIDENLPAPRSPVCHLVDGDGVAHGESASEFEAALLITGTAVGGGSIALPYFCQAGGFLPAVAMLLVGRET